MAKNISIYNVSSIQPFEEKDEDLKNALDVCNEYVDGSLEVQVEFDILAEAVAEGTVTGGGWTAKSNLDKFVEKCLENGALDDYQLNRSTTAKIALMCLKRLINNDLSGIEVDIAKTMNKILKDIVNG